MPDEPKEQPQQQELEAAWGDKKLRFRGSDWLSLLSTAVGVLLIYMFWEHKVEAKDIAKETAQVLREANKENLQAQKTQSDATIEALKGINNEQRKMNESIKMMVCLADPALRNRPDALEVCRRLNRENHR